MECLCKGLCFEHLRLRRPWIMDQGFVSVDPGKDDILPIFILCYGWQAQSGDPCPGGRTLPHLQPQTLGSPEDFYVPKGLRGDAERMVELVGIGRDAEVACEHEQAA